VTPQTPLEEVVAFFLQLWMSPSDSETLGLRCGRGASGYITLVQADWQGYDDDIEPLVQGRANFPLDVVPRITP
jgi:hypothetical protein